MSPRAKKIEYYYIGFCLSSDDWRMTGMEVAMQKELSKTFQSDGDSDSFFFESYDGAKAFVTSFLNHFHVEDDPPETGWQNPEDIDKAASEMGLQLSPEYPYPDRLFKTRYRFKDSPKTFSFEDRGVRVSRQVEVMIRRESLVTREVVIAGETYKKEDVAYLLSSWYPAKPEEIFVEIHKKEIFLLQG